MWRSKSRSPLRHKSIHELSRDHSGVATLEFALIAVPFLGLLVAIIESLVTQYHVTALDHAVQKYASELRSGAEIIGINSSLTRAQQVYDIQTKLAARLPSSFDPNKLQIRLVSYSTCSAAVGCWASEYSNYPAAVRHPPMFITSDTIPFNVGNAGDSAYLTVYYPLPAMSAIWSSAPTVMVNGEKAFGILSTAMWINDPSVGVFGTGL